ncbi:Uncharacterised protein [Mycobacteroides abscessus subsp. massiliense]|nr:Uncharacterised protein [Mycobacteroides abscessus subsp. massiliense]
MDEGTGHDDHIRQWQGADYSIVGGQSRERKNAKAYRDKGPSCGQGVSILV